MSIPSASTSHGLTGRNADREGLRQALAACRDGDTFVVTKLDRLARSVRGAHQIADDLAAREVKLSIAGSVYDLSLIHISEPTRRLSRSRMPSSA